MAILVDSPEHHHRHGGCNDDAALLTPTIAKSGIGSGASTSGVGASGSASGGMGRNANKSAGAALDPGVFDSSTFDFDDILMPLHPAEVTAVQNELEHYFGQPPL